MAGKKFEKGSEEFRFFGEFWKMAQKHYLPDGSDDYWDQLLTDAAMLGKKYNGLFFKCIIQGFLDYAEKASKEKNNE